MPIPPPISSHLTLCFGVASISLGNQARGTETVRPSASTTFSVSVVHETSTAVASLLSTKILMPILQEEISIFDDNPSNLSKFVATKAAIIRKVHELEPKLRVSPRMSHVYVWWLAVLHAEVEE